jgi:hypothetical protein
MRPFFSMLLAMPATLSLSGRVSAQQMPPPAPSVAAIKACIRQMDIGDKWTFTWNLVQVGAPRHPLNNYEALYAPAGEGRAKAYGYPVHVRYSVKGHADIDAIYWLIRDAGGHWQIPAICTMK